MHCVYWCFFSLAKGQSTYLYVTRDHKPTENYCCCLAAEKLDISPRSWWRPREKPKGLMLVNMLIGSANMLVHSYLVKQPTGIHHQLITSNWSHFLLPASCCSSTCPSPVISAGASTTVAAATPSDPTSCGRAAACGLLPFTSSCCCCSPGRSTPATFSCRPTA